MTYIKWAVRFIITVALLFWVFSQTDRESIWVAFRQAEKEWVLIAFIPYLISRVSASFRLTAILRVTGVPLSDRPGLVLHWESMFYGMFLPGGLGADAYKLIDLKRQFKSASTRDLSKALLWDRLVGFFVLIVIILLTVALLPIERIWVWGSVLCVVLGIALYWQATRYWFPAILPILPRVLSLSLVTQLMQILSIGLLLYSVQITRQLGNYIFLFLISSVASMLPLSIGGVGIRELVFMKGAQMLAISQTSFVATGVLFDLIVTLSAMTGGIGMLVKRQQEK